MRLLWIATKPPVPPIDGGRLVALLTLEALADAGVEIDLVAPVDPGASDAEIEEVREALAPVCRPHLVPVAPRAAAQAAIRSLLGGPPYSIARHTLPPVRTEVARLLAGAQDSDQAGGRFDAVHAEQLQALAQAEPAFEAGVPVVLRAQNVESDLWRATAGLHTGLRAGVGRWFAREARRLAKFEGEAVRRVAATVALTEPDAARLQELTGGKAEVVAIPPPFPSELPPADRPLPGEPPLVLLGSGGWLPNREGTRWFLEEVWPEVRAKVPGTVLHLFAAEKERPKRLPPGVVPHPPPTDSRDAFAPGSILVVPLRIASGIRMKILEAWARGVPVVATPAAAAAGLEAEDGREVFLGRDGREFSAAFERLQQDHVIGTGISSGGRRVLRGRFSPARVAATLLQTYQGLRPRSPSRR